MDPTELLKQILEARTALQKYMDSEDPEAALLGAINRDMSENRMDVQQNLTTLICVLGDQDERMQRGGFLPGPWDGKQKQCVIPECINNREVVEDTVDILYPQGRLDADWCADTTMELGNLLESHGLVPEEHLG